MVNTQSKELATTEEDAEKQLARKKLKRSMQVTMYHMAINVGINTLCVTTRPNVLLEMLKGDAQRTGQMLSTWAGGIGAVEYLLNPTVGRLSDAYGRKPFLLLGPLANLLLKGNMALNPSINNLMLERIVSGALTTMSGSTTCMAVLSDLVSGKGLAMEGAGLGSYAGLGCILGPFVGGQLLARTGNWRLPFALGSFLAGLQILMILTCFEETICKKMAFDWSTVNPFSFVRFVSRPACRRMPSPTCNTSIPQYWVY